MNYAVELSHGEHQRVITCFITDPKQASGHYHDWVCDDYYPQLGAVYMFRDQQHAVEFIAAHTVCGIVLRRVFSWFLSKKYIEYLTTKLVKVNDYPYIVKIKYCDRHKYCVDQQGFVIGKLLYARSYLSICPPKYTICAFNNAQTATECALVYDDDDEDDNNDRWSP